LRRVGNNVFAFSDQPKDDCKARADSSSTHVTP